ncbi:MULTISPECIES: cyclopropane-fatty-acyl-phospholipid synthase [unclassified Sphingobacterium]|uniref:cyclopropane-fatty-acyl-phospholipid synthase n=1 Tax=unclassified Sphingobacterium TaxID=2609468 RepID=UPI0025CDCB25|nr:MULTISPECIES: cyclopropane-fatty-acyl-phospholipid synthase [unclassified Sphingobacterium]
MENKDRVINRVGWVTQMKSTPPLTEEYIQRQYRFFENQIRFLQDNGFTTRIILEADQSASDESQITVGDLTPSGLKFYLFGIRPWTARYDKNKDKDKAVDDLSFINKKLTDFIKINGVK